MPSLTKLIVALHVWSLSLSNVLGRSEFPKHTYAALINITYVDPASNMELTEENEVGRFAVDHADKVDGIVVHVKSQSDGHSGCTAILNDIPRERWIALVERGNCKFSDKIRNALSKNASAVVVYDQSSEADLVTMEHDGALVFLVVVQY